MHCCLSCQSADFHENKKFGTLPRVTSDSTPFAPGGRVGVCLACGLVQKVTDAQWKNEISDIYRNYQMYALTEGADQPVFSAGGVTRAEKIAEILAAELPTDFAGTVIDIGCGTGGFLKAFGAKFPKAKLYGKEISADNLKYLEKIPNFQKLYTAQSPEELPRFDVITSIHCFEHLFDYAAFFAELEAIKTPDAVILLQVPDLDTSPFDIAIADHAAHFTRDTLADCLSRHLNNFVVSQTIDKELTAIVNPHQPAAAHSPAKPISRENRIAALNAHVDYLARLIAHIESQHCSEFGVYGTTIAGVWLTAAFQEKIAFYVDDDALKQGKKLYGKPILAAANVATNAKVVVPFSAATRQKILQRNPNLAEAAVYAD